MTDYIHRKIEETILKASKYFSRDNSLWATSIRQEYIANSIFPLYEKYSLKDLNILDYAKNDPIAFLNQTDRRNVY